MTIRSVRLTATALLVVLFLGMAVMTFTREWIGTLPNHDHLNLIEEREHHHEQTHHAHAGDDLARAFIGLADIATPRGILSLPTVGSQAGRAILSFSALSGQLDLSTFTASGALAVLTIAGRLLQRGWLWSSVCCAVVGWTTAPLAPPPRAVH